MSLIEKINEIHRFIERRDVFRFHNSKTYCAKMLFRENSNIEQKMIENEKKCVIVSTSPRKFTIALTSFVYVIVLSILFGYIVLDIDDVTDAIYFIIIGGPFLIVFLHCFLAAMILIFYWKPIFIVGSNSLNFSIIGLSIYRNEVESIQADIIESFGGARIAIKLKKPKSGRFRTTLFFPVTGAFGRNIYISTLWLASDGNKLARRIISSLSPDAEN